MKKLLLLILPLLAITFISCSKDDGGDNGDGGGNNKFVINGQTDTFKEGEMYYIGHYYSEDAINVDLYLECENGASIDVEMFCP